MWLAGYGSKRVPDGKLHDLWVKALALEDAEGRRAVLITSDFQGVPRAMSDRGLRAAPKRVRARTPPGDVHLLAQPLRPPAGGRPGGLLSRSRPSRSSWSTNTRTLMVEKLVALVGESLADSPRRVAGRRGQGDLRREPPQQPRGRRPGPAREGHAAGRAGGSHGAGDDRHPAGGELAAILFGYACHPTTLNFTTWCGDYPGFAQLELEQAHPGATAMFVNTCGGDQNPLPRRSVELCRRYGHMLATRRSRRP